MSQYLDKTRADILKQEALLAVDERRAATAAALVGNRRLRIARLKDRERALFNKMRAVPAEPEEDLDAVRSEEFAQALGPIPVHLRDLEGDE